MQSTYKFWMILQIVVILVSGFPIKAAAMEGDAMIQSFDALPPEVAEQTITSGEVHHIPVLPGELAAVIDGTPVVVAGVTWISSPPYDGETPNIYVFDPNIPNEYALNADAALPFITVTVVDAAKQTITFDIQKNAYGETAFYLPEGIPLTDADLLAGVTAVDENGIAVPVTVKDVDGLTMANPLPRMSGWRNEPYRITYAAQTAVGREVTETRDCYVTMAVRPLTASINNEIDLRGAVESGGETDVVLIGDISLTAMLTIQHTLTLDLNGNNLTIITSSDPSSLKIANGVTLTIKDSQPGTNNKLTVTNNDTNTNNPLSGAGINVSAGELVIESGTVVATGGGSGAGIGGGGGESGGVITIIGTANVKAYGYAGGAGIGGGSGDSGGVITIGGYAQVEAISVYVSAPITNGGAGIGGGNCGASGTIIITDNAQVTATGGAAYSSSFASGGGAGIGSGGGLAFSSILQNSRDSGTITISGAAIVNATGGAGDNSGTIKGNAGAGIGTGGGVGTGAAGVATGAINGISITTTGTVTATGGAANGMGAGANIGRGGANGVKGTATIPVINATSGANGSIAPQGTVFTTTGTGYTFTFTADSGYEISQVLIDGINNPTAKQNGYASIIADIDDHTIHVEFVAQPAVTFTVLDGVDLKYATPLSFQINNFTALSGSDFTSIQFMNVTKGGGYGGYPLTTAVGVTYNSGNGLLTLPNNAANNHITGTPGNSSGAGSALTPGDYRAEIVFTNATSGLRYYYIIDFTLIDSTTYTLTVEDGLGSGQYAVGTPVNITANAAPSGKIFDRWTGGNGGSFANANNATTAFTMPSNNAVVTATYKNNGSGGGNGGSSLDGGSRGGSGGISWDSGYIVCNTIHVPYNKTGDSLASSVSAQTLKSIVNKAFEDEDGGKIVKFDYSIISGASRLTLTFNASKLKANEDVTFIIETRFGVFIFTTKQMLAWFDSGKFGSYTLTLEKSSLKLNIKKGSKNAVWSYLTPIARIGVPYALKSGKSAANIIMTDKNGRILPTSVYENGMVYADIYMPGTYKSVAAPSTAFADTKGHWAQANIDFVTMRGLISGVSDKVFSPETAITCVEYITALGKLSGADVSGYKRSSFADIPVSNVYMPYIEWALANNIIEGIGGDLFALDAFITREQMAVMMLNYAKVLGYALPTGNSVVVYADNTDISGWAVNAVTAMQKADIMTSKDNNNFVPQSNITRAEAATILRRFVENVICSRDAEGFSNANTDLNKRVYYNQNGCALTGWTIIDGKRYYFNEDGTLAVNTTSKP